MQSSRISASPPLFDLSPFYADLQAQAQEVAARFADRHREVRLHPFEHGELHPELWGEISERGRPGLAFRSSTAAARAGCSPTSS